MNTNKRNDIKRYRNYCLLFGLAMGMIFPFYSIIFVSFKSYTAAVIFISGCLAAGLFVGAFAYLIGHLTLITKFRSLTGSLQVLSGKKDLTAQVQVTSSDETGRALNQFNKFVKEMNDNLRSLQKLFDKVHHFGLQIHQRSDHSFNLMAEIGDQIHQIMDSVILLDNEIASVLSHSQNLSSFTEEVTASVSDQAISIREVSAHVTDIDRAMNKTAQESKKIHAAMLGITDDAGASEQEVTVMVEAVQNVSSATEEMLSFISVINRIAGQTNMLAMNAAIEAAHAGEAGSGFAVVASEIRNLAEDTASRSKLISRSLKDIISSIETAETAAQATGDNIRGMAERIRDSLSHIRSTEQNISNVASSVDRVNGELDEIASSVRQVEASALEMSRQSVSVSENTENLSHISKRTRKSMQTISGIMEDMNKHVRAIQQSGGDNKNVVESGLRILGRYQTGS